MLFNIRYVYLTFIHISCRLIFNPFRTVAAREATNKMCTVTISCCGWFFLPYFCSEFAAHSLHAHLFWILNHAKRQECSPSCLLMPLLQAPYIYSKYLWKLNFGACLILGAQLQTLLKTSNLEMTSAQDSTQVKHLSRC